MGLSMADLDEIPWGELVLMLQARAQSYRKDDEVEEASTEQVFAFFGASSKK